MFASKVKELKLNADKTVSFEEDSNLTNRSSFNPDQICLLLDLCLNTTYFTYRYDLTINRDMAAPWVLSLHFSVRPIVDNLHMEEVEKKGLNSFATRTPTH